MTDKNIYKNEIEKMIDDFVNMAESVYEDPEDNPWEPVSHENEPLLDVFRLEGTDNCFKVVAEVKALPEVAFDLLADISKRSEWDDLCEHGEVLEIVDASTRIQYMKTKAIWPTSSRDVVVLAFLGKMSDRKYINVTRSFEYSKKPTLESKGIVRMEAKIAGQIITECIDKPGYCRIVQVADGDLKGWMPASVLGYIATKAIPLSFKKVAKLLSSLPTPAIKNGNSVSSTFIQAIEQSKDAFNPFVNKQDIVIVSPLPPSSTTNPSTSKPTPSQLVPRRKSVAAKKSVPHSRFHVLKSIIATLTDVLGKVSPWMIFFLFVRSFSKELYRFRRTGQ